MNLDVKSMLKDLILWNLEARNRTGTHLNLKHK
jgi:hypothetical protein